MQLIPLLFTVFIDSLGFGLVFPIFSPLIVNNDGGMFSPEVSLAMRGLIFGFLISAFCFGQLVGGPILGALSDRIGRKKVLIGSMWVAVIGYLFGAFGIIIQSLFILFLARIIGGLAAGSYAVAQSVMADVSGEKEKTKNFGLIGMAWGTGFVIGPYLGGKLAAYGYTVPFIGAGIFCLVNALMIFFMFKESLVKKVPAKISLFSGIYQIRKAFSIPTLRGVFFVMFIFSLGWGFFTEFSPIFLMRNHGFSVSQIGDFYAWAGLWIALSQGLLIRPIVKRVSPNRLLPFALLSLGVVLFIMLFMEGSYGLFWMLPFVAFAQSLIFPTATTIVSNASNVHSQGEILGIYNSIQWSAIAISPLFSGALVALYPHLPITVGSGCMVVAFIACLWAFRKIKRLPEEEKVEIES